eukprot:scaffold49013_cov53-Phaeocystis_antarctica.AAC.1
MWRMAGQSFPAIWSWLMVCRRLRSASSSTRMKQYWGARRLLIVAWRTKPPTCLDWRASGLKRCARMLLLRPGTRCSTTPSRPLAALTTVAQAP